MIRVGIGAALMLVVVAMLTLWRDDPPPQDADLRPAPAVVAEADNAYPVYLALQSALPLSTQEKRELEHRLKGQPFDAAVFDGVVARSTAAVALFAEFSRRAAFSDPNFNDPASVRPETPVPQMNAVVSAAKLDAIRADELLKRGRAAEALALALTIVDAGRMLERSRSSLLPGLVGLILFDLGTERVSRIVASGRLTEAQLTAAAARLAVAPEGSAGIQSGLKYEYMMHANVLDHLTEYAARDARFQTFTYRLIFASMKRGHYYLFLPNRSKALAAARFRTMVTEAGKPCALARVPPFEMLPFWGRPNMIGILLYDIGIPQYDKISQRRCGSDFRLTRAATEAALGAYRRDHGRSPADLSELSPRYLPAAPLDPFTGDPLRYSAETGAILSTEKDSDGKPL